MTIILKNKDTLLIEDFKIKCCVGKNGLTSNKVEGDKKTPIGTFELDKLYYRKDKFSKPKTELKCVPIDREMGWCNDLNNPQKYNKIIKRNKKIKHEKIFRSDSKYDFIIPIKYNFKKPILGKGSAIFLHITKNYRSTDGCIAISKNDFLILLRLINKKTKIKIS